MNERKWRPNICPTFADIYPTRPRQNPHEYWAFEVPLIVLNGFAIFSFLYSALGSRPASLDVRSFCRLPAGSRSPLKAATWPIPLRPACASFGLMRVPLAGPAGCTN